MAKEVKEHVCKLCNETFKEKKMWSVWIPAKDVGRQNIHFECQPCHEEKMRGKFDE